MTRLEAIRRIADAFDWQAGETCVTDAEYGANTQDMIDSLHALGVTAEEYEEAFRVTAE